VPRFASNCYRHSAQLILGRKGQTGYTLLSGEGITQGDPLYMVLYYGLALVPLAATLRQVHPEVVQAWYADDGQEHPTFFSMLETLKRHKRQTATQRDKNALVVYKIR
jgi:hypothetical protein